MKQSDKSKSAPGRRRPPKTEALSPEPAAVPPLLPPPLPPVVEAEPAPVPPPEPAPPQAVELHSDFQELSRRAADLETRAGELEQELQKSRDDAKAAGVRAGHAAELEQELQKAREDADARSSERDRRIAQLSGELEKARDEAGSSNARASGIEEQLKKAHEEAVRAEARLAGLDETLKDLKTLQESRDRTEMENAQLRMQLLDLKEQTRKADALRQKSQDDGSARAAAEQEVARLRMQVTDLKEQLRRSEAQTADAKRYFESLERELIEARGTEEQAAALRAELEQLKETCREQEEGLDELGQTVIDLERKLQEAAELPPPRPPEPVAPAVEAQKIEAPPLRIEIDIEPTAPPPPQAIPAPLPSAETTLRPQNFFGPDGADGQPVYLLHEILPGDATMGVTYRASERAGGRTFAVRFMSGQAGEEQTQAIEREVEKLIALPHPNILHVQGSGRRKNRLYLAMDLVEGPTLGQSKILDLRRICTILRDAASAVHYAHEEGIFHGDLNPENILVARGEEGDLALVKDFELAHLLETLPGPAPEKEPRPALRNPAYLPPEQTKSLSIPADVYGLGATLYAALTGRAPFEGKDLKELKRKVMFEEPPPIEKIRSGIPPALSTVVRRAMVKESGLRHATAQEFAAALTKILETL